MQPQWWDDFGETILARQFPRFTSRDLRHCQNPAGNGAALARSLHLSVRLLGLALLAAYAARFLYMLTRACRFFTGSLIADSDSIPIDWSESRGRLCFVSLASDAQFQTEFG